MSSDLESMNADFLIFRREAPAKVNLWLRILGKRADGFHELDTRMVRISLADTLEAWRGADGSGLRFTCDDPSLPVDASNLVVKAVRALEGAVERSFDLAIHLTKRIPHGAGLGGGSSDAATVLLGINQALELGLDRGTLSRLASGLGSDIPFFLWEGACDCRGRGEEVVPLAPDAFPWRPRLLLVKPAFAVPTPWAYREWMTSQEIPGIDYAACPMPWGELVNSLERPVFAKHLVLADLKRFLSGRSGVSGALMSGSGSVVFAILEEGANPGPIREAILEEFGESTWTEVVTILP
jgi:4-diphosphocytidyl-2-C-methyl-D-erythritol kinase